MIINFSDKKCQFNTEKRKFGICDDTPPPAKPAYIDEADGSKWIAVVVNEEEKEVTFTAIDNCIEIKSKTGKMEPRCDGVLICDTTIAFVELKKRDIKGNRWVKDAEKQLHSTISYFERYESTEIYAIKRAYIANHERPVFRESQKERMEKFLSDTGYVLRIESRIILD